MYILFSATKNVKIKTSLHYKINYNFYYANALKTYTYS